MKAIASTTIGNYTVNIYEDAGRTDDAGCDGFTEGDGHETIQITMDPGLSPDKYWETFFHELAHAADMALGLGLSHPVVHQIGYHLGKSAQAFQWHDKPSVMKAKKKANRTVKKRRKGKRSKR